MTDTITTHKTSANDDSCYTRQTVDAILAISRMMSLRGNFEEHLPRIMEYFSMLFGVERSSLFLLSGEQMRFMLMSRFAEGLEKEISLDLKMGLVGTSILNNKMINITNAYNNIHFNPEVDRITGTRTESTLCAPLPDRNGNVVGALELVNKQTGVFTSDDEKLLAQCITELSFIDLNEQDGTATAAKLLQKLKDEANCAHCTIFEIDQQRGELRSVVTKGLDGKQLKLSFKLGVAGTVAVTGKEVLINDAYVDPRFDSSTDKKTGFQTKQILCVPLQNHAEETIGVIQLINKKTGAFTAKDMEMLQSVSTLVAIYIDNSIQLEESRKQFESILEVMAASVDAKDPLTASHSKMVREYAMGIAREMGFKEEDIDILSVAAWLHDYGKIGVKESILTKPGRLSEEEYNHIKTHATCTRTILEKMFFAQRYRNVPLIASCHHERLDGKGYGAGLTAEEIPFMSKIIAVADVFDALTAKRHYRDALPAEKAFAILEEGIGTQFDQNIVTAMKSYWEKHTGSPG